MSRRLVVWFAVFATALLVVASPVSAASVGSVHSTATDFQNATTLDNVEVVGSGDSASVRAPAVQTYNPVDDEGDGTAAGSDYFVGDLGASKVHSEIRIEPTFTANVNKLRPTIAVASGSDYDDLLVDIYIVQEAPDGTYGEGTLVANDWDPDFSTGEQSIPITDYAVTAGTTYTIEFVTQSTSGDGNSDFLSLSRDGSATSVWYRDNVFGSANVYGDIDVVSLPDLTSGTYVSDTHTVDNAESGFINLSLNNARAEVTWLADTDSDGTFETEAATATYSTSGTKSLDVSGTDSSDWRVNVTFVGEAGQSSAELFEEGVMFDPSPPSLSGPSPADGSSITSYDGDVSINLSDPDFGTAQGDNVYIVATNESGGEIGNTTVTSNQTVTFSYSALAGQNTVSWTASDSYGTSNATFDQTFTTPATLQIRKEQSPDELITNSSANVTIRFFGETEIVRESDSDSDGQIDLSGIPADDEIIVEANADGYYGRRIVIDSLFEQSSVYLLNQDAQNTVNTTLELNDETGEYPAAETKLYVERPITRNNSTEYRVVSADYFGATGRFPVTVIEDDRYQLVLETRDGNRRELGMFIPDAAQEAQIISVEVTSGVIDREEGETYAWDATLTESDDIVFSIDANDTMSGISVVIFERGNETNEIYDQTVASATSDQRTIPLTANQSNLTWVVEWSATLNGEPIDGRRIVGSERFVTGIPIDSQWLHIFSIFGVLLFGGLFGGLRAELGGVGVSVAAGVMFYLGWLPPSLGTITIVGGLAISVFYVVGPGRFT